MTEEKFNEVDINLDFLHELRTDMTVIGGYTSFILESHRGSLSEEQAESLDAIKKSYQKVIALTNAFTDFIRLNHDLWKLTREDLDLNSIIKNEVESIKYIFAGEKIDFIVNLPDGKAEARGNPNAISRAINYLLVTGINFTPQENKKVFISLVKEDNILTGAIQSNGPGIPIDEIGTLFNPFYQSPSLFDGKKESGLPLIVAKKIFNLHKGNLSIKSESSQGIKIFFSIPAKVLKAPKKILIVEDNLVVAKMWARLLKEEFAVSVSTNGKEAINKAKSEKFDLIILDILMPEMDGFEVYGKLKEDKVTSGVPIFILSNLVQKDLEDKIKKMDIAGYFVKANLSPTLLKEKIKKIVENGRETEED